MSAELIYKTTSPQALEWWADVERRHQENQDRLKEFRALVTERFGPGGGDSTRDFFTQRGWGAPEIVGILPNAAEESEPPAGLRFDKKRAMLVPRLQSKAGKDLAKLFSDYSPKSVATDLDAVGVLDGYFGSAGDRGSFSMARYTAGFDFDAVERVLYQLWATAAPEEEILEAQQKVPDVEWIPVPKSEWYAHEERLEAAKKANA